MTVQMTHAEAVSVIAEKVEEIERLQTELAELRKAQGEPIGYFCDVNSLTPEQGKRIEQVVEEAKHDPDVFPLYTSAPTIPEGYVLVHESVLEAANHAAECVVLENMHRPGFTFGRLVKLAEAIAAAPKPTKDAA